MRNVFLALLMVSAAGAQTSVVEGQIQHVDGVDSSWLTVHLVGPLPGGNRIQGDVDMTGSFRLFGAAPGAYELQVLDRTGNELVSQYVQVNSPNTTVSVSLPERKREAESNGVISVARLRHKPKAAASKAFLRAQNYSDKHQFDKAAFELQKAIAADPDYIEAYSNLGVQYMRLARYQEAVQQFRKAIELDPGTGIYYSNMALVMAKIGPISEAQSMAFRGVELDSANPRARFVLGWVLAKQPQTLLQSIPQLQYAARQIPSAHRLLAEVYKAAGEEPQAQEEMRLYASASPQTASQAENSAAKKTGERPRQSASLK